MPVSSGRWLSSSVNASRPPAEAPTPTMGGELPSARFPAAGRTIATAETGLTAAVEVFPGGVVRRFGLGESGARGEHAISPGRRLPVFFAKRHHYLSRRDERASSLEREPDQQSTLRATFAPVSAPAQIRVRKGHGACSVGRAPVPVTMPVRPGEKGNGGVWQRRPAVVGQARSRVLHVRPTRPAP